MIKFINLGAEFGGKEPAKRTHQTSAENQVIILLAQLVAPPIQPGPARLPEREIPTSQPATIQLDIDNEANGDRKDEKRLKDADKDIINIEGKSPYSIKQTKEILGNCDQSLDSSRADSCITKLNARLQKDGYINSRVVAETINGTTKLIIIPGRLVEINVSAKNKSLGEEIENKLKPLLDETFNIITIKNSLLNLERSGIASKITGSIGKLGSNPTKATLNITVESVPSPWRGETSIRNDGNTGSGEWRGVAIVQKKDLLARGDQLQFYGELNADSDPELGAGIGSLSYTYPLSQTVDITASFGANRRYLIEFPKPFRDLSFRQYQGLIQANWTLQQTAASNTYAFAGISANHNNSYYKNEPFPVIVGGGLDGDLTTGYFRVGFGHQGIKNSLLWTGQIYGLQGISSFSSADEINALNVVGIQPSNARAIGAYATGLWAINQKLIAKAIAGGQYAFHPLTSSMGFSVGSDNGLRGLPGTLISGDNGWIGNLELEWSLKKFKDNEFKLVPFGGAGGIQTTRLGITFNDTVGSYGVLLRWLHKNQLSVDLGWAKQMNVDDNAGLWNDWTLGNGLYTKVSYRF